VGPEMGPPANTMEIRVPPMARGARVEEVVVWMVKTRMAVPISSVTVFGPIMM